MHPKLEKEYQAQLVVNVVVAYFKNTWKKKD
jgi:hypothetical protein